MKTCFAYLRRIGPLKVASTRWIRMNMREDEGVFQNFIEREFGGNLRSYKVSNRFHCETERADPLIAHADKLPVLVPLKGRPPGCFPIFYNF